MINIRGYRGGMLDSTTYLIYDSGEAMIIDCGKNVSSIAQFVSENGLFVKYIVLSHGHFDHTGLLDSYVSAFDEAKIVCHENEVQVLKSSEANLSEYLFDDPCVFNYDFMTVCEGDTLTVGKKEFKVLHTPGHTPGSICLFCEEENDLFTGDLLFENGYGRTDFPLGSWDDLKKSLSRVMSSYPDADVFPGHGHPINMKNIRF